MKSRLLLGIGLLRAVDNFEDNRGTEAAGGFVHSFKPSGALRKAAAAVECPLQTTFIFPALAQGTYVSIGPKMPASDKRSSEAWIGDGLACLPSHPVA